MAQVVHGQGHETINFRIRRSKAKVTGRLEIHLEASFTTLWVE